MNGLGGGSASSSKVQEFPGPPRSAAITNYHRLDGL